MSGDSEQDGNAEIFEDELSNLTCYEQALLLGGWADCEIVDCPHKACLHLNSKFCWPHTVGVQLNWSQGLTTKARERLHDELEARYLERRAAK